jgi:hypothetical protein
MKTQIEIPEGIRFVDTQSEIMNCPHHPNTHGLVYCQECRAFEEKGLDTSDATTCPPSMDYLSGIAAKRCLDIYNDFDAVEIVSYPPSVRLAWACGCSLANAEVSHGDREHQPDTHTTHNKP